MREETRRLIQGLSEVPWFKHVGKDVDGSVVQVRSWKDAIRTCASIEWRSVQIQVNNLLAIKVSEADYDRFRLFNDVVTEIEEFIFPLVQQIAEPILKEQNLPKRFIESVILDVSEICLEVEYSDIVSPIFFYSRVMPWYGAGHFPCGWDGPMITESWEGPVPNGKVIVF